MITLLTRTASATTIALACLLLNPAVALAADSPATQRLKERNKMFEPKVAQVAPNVYVATGYQVTANSMIVGDDGVIIVDPGQLPALAQKVRAEFEKITDKPVKAIIYTHGHGDHVNGAPAFYAPGVEVWARSNFGSEAARNQMTGMTGGVRPSNTQGFDLLPEQKIGIGVAIPPNRRPSGNMMQDGVAQQRQPRRRPQRIEPTHTFPGKRLTLTISGVDLELVAAPGETDDQLYVWLPEHQVVFAGDNFYQSWPNVYPLRGTARRSARDWIASLTSMVEEGPEILVGGHTTPMDDATTVLTNYRDALKWVYDRTIEGAQKYMTPDELVEYAALPPHLAKLDYVANYYGSAWGTVRDVYAQDLGWFDGDPLSLHRESPRKQSERMAQWLGGVDALMAKAREAMDADDPLGAAQLVQHVVRLRPDDKAAKLLMADALAVLGERTFNAPARNYTISSANRFRREAQE